MAQFLCDQNPTEEEEDKCPGWGDPKTIPDAAGLHDPPAPQHDVPHTLDCLCVRHNPGKLPRPDLGHPLQWPEDATEQQLGNPGTNCQLHGISRGVADGGEKYSKTHSNKSLDQINVSYLDQVNIVTIHVHVKRTWSDSILWQYTRHERWMNDFNFKESSYLQCPDHSVEKFWEFIVDYNE